jgi:glycosyltransferase involved in cell wall biosynthesis
LYFSIIIPVFNRPKELDELLQSIAKQQCEIEFEILIIDDGSEIKSDSLVEEYKNLLNIKYFYKENSGPGGTRNFGTKKAQGQYFIFLDSDCILPNNYLNIVYQTLKQKYTDAYGGADAAHTSFSSIQKAINYSMTSLLTTGGIRGNERARNKFQLRSFNMGVSKKAFIKTGGFDQQRIGEDIDLSFKLLEKGFETQFIPKAYVFHKRRIHWSDFFNQTFRFGAARPILNLMHPSTAKVTFWFPCFFVLGFLFALTFLFFGYALPILLFAIYPLVIFFDSLIKNKNLVVAFQSIIATFVQFFGYGLGFLRTVFRLNVLKYSKKEAFPKMFS